MSSNGFPLLHDRKRKCRGATHLEVQNYILFNHFEDEKNQQQIEYHKIIIQVYSFKNSTHYSKQSPTSQGFKQIKETRLPLDEAGQPLKQRWLVTQDP